MSLSLDWKALNAHEATALARVATLWICFDQDISDDTVIPRSLKVLTGYSISLEVTEYENCSVMSGSSYKLMFGVCL